MIAIVAGSAPFARTTASTLRAISRFLGYGMPWVMIVDSSATTGRPAARASATGRLRVRRSLACTLSPRRGSSAFRSLNSALEPFIFSGCSACDDRQLPLISRRTVQKDHVTDHG
jgi:hypothetical protein